LIGLNNSQEKQAEQHISDMWYLIKTLFRYSCQPKFTFAAISAEVSRMARASSMVLTHGGSSSAWSAFRSVFQIVTRAANSRRLTAPPAIGHTRWRFFDFTDLFSWV